MVEEKFRGDQKVGTSLLGKIEKRFVNAYVAKVPPWLETYHLTLLTIPWSGCVMLFSYLANTNIHWLWGASLVILLQYITDLFDGAVGRYRNTGLIKWGYYMDHYLDYVFLSSILVGYSFIVDDPYKILFFILITFGAFMVNSFLAFSAIGEFRISYFKLGPTEARLVFIIINILIIFFGETNLAWTLPYVLVFALIALNVIVFKTQKMIWDVDMKAKMDT